MDLILDPETTAGAASKAGSAADALAARLQAAIVAGQFAVGSSLPSERELMTRHGVSRTTVREALRVLGARGLIEVRRGRSGGSYIANRTARSLAQSLDLFIRGHDIRFVDIVMARAAIEPAAAAQAAVTRSDAQLEALRLACIACERTFNDPKGFVEANLEWHLVVAKASNNPLFVAILAGLWSALHASTDLEEFDLKTRKAVIGVHWQIFGAIRAGDPDAARRRMARHLAAYEDRLASIDPDAGRSAAAVDAHG